MRKMLAVAALAALGAGTAVGPAAADQPAPGALVRPEQRSLRVATYNVSLNRPAAGELAADLAAAEPDPQAQALAQVLQTARPDVVLLNEFDYDAAGESVDLFRERYLEVPQHGAAPITYPYAYAAPVNTGEPSGLDLDNDGAVGGPGDAFGFGEFPGQYGMVVLSRYPIATDEVRTFQGFRWRDMPGALLPDDPATDAPADWFSPEELAAVRLSSKSHWDVPVQVGRSTVHVLAAHPTPPTFDGAEDRNGRRNHDEIRFWADYVTGGRTARYIYDDQGGTGGLDRGERFVVLGDLNADPVDGDSYPGAVDQVLEHRLLRDPSPTSVGAVEAAAEQGRANVVHDGDPALDTADFTDDPGPGNLRVDYVLPSRGLPVRDAGVFWPAADQPGSELTGQYPFPTSDHRMVWVDLHVPGLR
ncbi:endonuclease/exonuclease/phosphatase family protein [Georgenia sp. TF02-10]|uniref:endonuclease/exonuclease/phosphatase family protein n=1 Tax=Georgenia sp. TF02-10 TaxID=2917725 RepID=UPI001FA78F2B|nr:endonuclease/exonuclease/phosphatase family protein [Georgenia sp. TF02-10]UNX55874.1 endonuclease/exonuclease/phosphatase family protein [Georgenia sp. TF02-10]